MNGRRGRELQVNKIEMGGWYEAFGRITEEQVAFHMYGFNGVQRGNYFGGEPIRRTEVKVRVVKLMKRMAAGK